MKKWKNCSQFSMLTFQQSKQVPQLFYMRNYRPSGTSSKLIRTKCDFTRNKGQKKCITIIIFFLKDYNKMDIFGQIFAGPDESQPPLYVPLGLLPARKYTFSTLILVLGGHSTTTWIKFYQILTPSPREWTIVGILHDT